MNVYMQPLGPVQANCYVIEKDGHALLIDPGDRFPQLKPFLEKEDIQLDAILLTHAHFDHMAGLDSIVKEFQVPVYMSPYEFDFLSDGEKNASVSFGRFIRFTNIQPISLDEGKTMISNFEVQTIHCPGHTIGSNVYIIGNNMFTGDVLFLGSMGRTDLPTGSDYAMEKSLVKLKKLTENYHIYPGHGPETTLDYEKSTNFYLRRL
ncbi:MAG: MBL fold metallo-hydrolase [Bacillota bacterium]|nr:MBL fold metallo-hydrolase [Bacillota bacterium]